MPTDRGALPFDRVADHYDATRGGEARGRAVAEVLDGLLPRGEPVLEVGVGTGLVAIGMVALGWQVVGLDLSVPMLRLAAGRVPGRVALADARNLPAASGSVGSAYLIHVLHVVGDQERTLAEVARVVRPGGRVAITVEGLSSSSTSDDIRPVIESLQRELDVPERRPDHVTLVVPAARRHGLTVVEELEIVDGDEARTPLEVADLLRSRTWSWTWRIADEVWEPAARRAIDRLIRLPRPDAARRHPRTGGLLVLERTAGDGSEP